ncbi:alkaline phosphatase family protein [Oerskovia sp. Sa1BUA8]|uniref:Alkaline phosphatase family protein n=1 Tax=Oerskovia douganii TaxID=2762210 RepID=A0A9D5U5I3_9CELL|nr:phage holin family protein [Oerskovia douganii]MBE7698898.1 alkaline phosphatase family protein [Oerskovia douganii]
MRHRLPFSVHDLTGALWSLVSTTAGLALAIWCVPGVRITSWWSVFLAAFVVGVGDAVLRPLWRLVAGRAGVLGALVSGLVGQVLVAWLALTYLPGFETDDWGSVVAVLVLAAFFMAIGRWAVGASDNEYVIDHLLRRARRAQRAADRRAQASTAPGDGEDGGAAADRSRAGLLVVQLDGVARETFDHAVQAGLAPNLARWLSSGTHELESWWARVPSTTPASQAGLLHGTSEHVPAFRWWDRAQGRLVVTNRPADAAQVEAAMSDGRGLLAGGGVAVSTMFSGDAATNLLVMSRARAGLGPGQLFVHFFSSPFVLVRALVATVGEFFKELYQGWQQAVRDVVPRVSRLGAYPVLRAVSNVVLRDLNTSLVAEQLVRGAPVVFVDLVDYDEIAHHAGPLRPEAMRALEGLDRVVGLWEQVAEAAPRRYEVVVLSDHGQALGATFEQVVGRSFLDEVRRLMAARPAPVERRRRAAGVRSPASADSEAWGAVNTALNVLGRGGAEDVRGGRVLVGPDREPAPGDAGDLPEVAVVGSGNLGLVWFPRSPVRLVGDEIRARWPALVPGLVANPAVGVVVVQESGPVQGEVPDVVAYGPAGSRHLVTGEVHGQDPLAPYGPRAAPDLLRAASLEHAGDLLLVSSVDDAGLVHAFEGLVGSHGGLGGAQNEAVLLYPASLRVADAAREDVGGRRMLVGAEAVHRVLVGWLEELGVRT